ncbi:MAG TPA: rhodanese-like domain-containing protein [Gaiellales bacterium]|nr:rhodanese-like domain-containing protein [Gaiellales bacterium]
MGLFTRTPRIDAEGAHRLLGDGQAVLLDVREHHEWSAGHAPGAVHIPLRQLPERHRELPDGRRLVVACRSGGRSARAVKFLHGVGVAAENLEGGMIAWKARGLPLQPGNGSIR